MDREIKFKVTRDCKELTIDIIDFKNVWLTSNICIINGYEILKPGKVIHNKFISNNERDVAYNKFISEIKKACFAGIEPEIGSKVKTCDAESLKDIPFILKEIGPGNTYYICTSYYETAKDVYNRPGFLMETVIPFDVDVVVTEERISDCEKYITIKVTDGRQTINKEDIYI